MSAEKAVLDLLTSVSSSTYLNLAPDTTTPPYIVVSRIGEDVGYKLNGEPSKQVIFLQIQIFATTIGAAMDLSNSVKTAMSLQTNTAHSVTMHAAFLTNTFALYDEETKLHRVIHDYKVFYSTT